MSAVEAFQCFYLLELWDDLMFLAEMMLRDRTASAALSSTSALFLIRPGTQSRAAGQHPVVMTLQQSGLKASLSINSYVVTVSGRKTVST